MKHLLIVLLFILATSGCMTNYYEQYYTDKDRAYFDDLTPMDLGEEVLLKVAISESDVLDMMEDGYLPIGVSSFYSPYNTMVCAVDTAEKHGAQAVLLDIKFKETKEYTSVIFLPSTTTSYSYGTSSATAYGRYGSATAYGTYTGTTTSTTMNAVPVQKSVDLYTHNALFFKKVDPKSFYGVIPFIPKRLPTEKVSDSVPVTILAVLHGSKAEADGLKRGMKVKSINNNPISNRKSIAPYSKTIKLIESVEVIK